MSGAILSPPAAQSALVVLMPALPPNPQTGVAPVQPAGPTFAAVLLLVLIALGATLSIGSAWLLWRGEKHDPAVLALPAGCAGVVLVDKPAEAAAALARALAPGGLPAPLAEALRPLGPILQRLATVPGLRAGESAAVCLQAGGAVLAIPTADPQASAAVAKWPGLPAAPATAVQLAGDVLLLATTAVSLPVAGTPASVADAAALLATGPALGVGQPATKPAVTGLATDLLYREATERVGPGQLHLYLSPRALQGWLAPLLPAAWQSGLPLAQWFGLSVLAREQDVRVHVQFGAEQQGAVWLKEHFDFRDDLAAAKVWPTTAPLTGNLRVQREGWDLLSVVVPPLAQLQAQFPQADSAAIKVWRKVVTGQVGWWQQGPCLGSAAVVPAGTVLADLPPPATTPGCIWKRQLLVLPEQSLLVTAHEPDLAGAVATLQAGTAVRATTNMDGDAQRLSTDTQGWRLWQPANSGQKIVALQVQSQLDWLWLDRGLVAGWTFVDGPATTR